MSSRREAPGEAAPSAGLEQQLQPLGVSALLVLGSSAAEPDLAPFLRGARLGEAYVVAPVGGTPRLGYWTPMERDEAAATGLELLPPELLELPRLARENPEAAGYLAAALSAALERCGVAPSRIALAGSWPAGTLAEALALLREAGWEFTSGATALRRWRKRKAEAEVAEIRRVARVTGDAFRRIASLLAAARITPSGALELEGEPLTVARLKRAVALHFAAEGLTQPRENILSPGEEGGVPHTTGTPDRVLRAGESLVADLFPKGDLFADCTRTFCVGEPPEALRRAHADTLAALELAHGASRAGERGWEVQRQVCALLDERGWPTPVSTPGTLRGYVHNLGHGVGYELHELPSFRDAGAPEDGLIEAGDVVTLEPGLYEPAAGGFGVRLEDLAVVTASGLENLTPLPYELDPRAWSDRSA